MSARVYGTVTDSATGEVITTAVVTAPPYDVTNTSGTYTFVTPGAAQMTVTASASNYTPLGKTVSVTNGANKKVDFALVHV